MTLLVFFLILSTLVLIHEFGHFYVAKKSGMLVEEFGFGLPPRIFAIKVGETLYSVNILPFGGFVKIFGESSDDLKGVVKSNLKRAFNSKPWYQRGAVIIAGPVMNFLLAVVVTSYLFSKGLYLPTGRIELVKVEKNSPAQYAGLRAKDLLVSLKKDKLYTFNSTEQLVELSQKYAGEMVEINFIRNGKKLSTRLVPSKKPPKGQGPLGIVITPEVEFRKYSLLEAPLVGLKESINISIQFYRELLRIIGRFIFLKFPQVEVAGPVGIAKLTGQAVKNGFDSVIQLLGLLSLNLALINIFPFPALDGGQLTFVLYEGITRRKINEELKTKINTAGLVILLFLIILITVNDIKKAFN